jgi:hypothetical protein
MIVSEKKINVNLNGYDTIDQSLIVSKNFVRNFGTEEDYIEVHIYTMNDSLIYSEYGFTGYKVPGELQGEVETTTNQLEFSPGKLLQDIGYTAGTYKVNYNVLRKKIINTYEKVFFIKEISPDRKEIRVASNGISNNDIQVGVLNFISEIQSSPYFKDFLINFGDNKIVNAVNIALDINTNPYSILIKLYKALPSEFEVKDSFWFAEEMSTPVVYEVDLFPEIPVQKIPFLKSANFDIELDQHGNKSSEYYNLKSLLSKESTIPYQEVLNKLSSKGIQINVDYSDYSNFVHFSSATTRLLNFVSKVESIESYTEAINKVRAVPYYSASLNLSQSIYSYESSVDDIVKNFDGYESHLYFESSSTSWPKSNFTKPYTLFPSTSSEAISWIGSYDDNSIYYGGQLLTSSLYDLDNQDSLVYSIPEYIRVDSVNAGYDKFIELIGQHFDSIWIYIKSITDLNKASNNLKKGISKDLVYYALKSLGIKIYNSKSNDDLYSYLIGSTNSGSYSPTSDGYSYLVSASNETIPGQDLQKELLKRIYHNIPSLLKRKGTNSGLEELITIFGIPSTVLVPTQFGGADKSSATVEYTYDRFSYALHNSGSHVQILWAPLLSAATGSFVGYVPDSIELRIKPDRGDYYMTSSILEATRSGSATASFGVNISPDTDLGYPYSKFDFYLIGTSGVESASISVPYHHTSSIGENYWWNILLTRNNHTDITEVSQSQEYTLIVANKIDDRVGHQASASIYISGSTSASFNEAWSNTYQDLKLVDYTFTGLLQEFRYWAEPLTKASFYYHVLNPESVEGNTSSSAYNNLAARFLLGNNLTVYNHYFTGSLESKHPNQNNRVFYNAGYEQVIRFTDFPNIENYVPVVEEYVTNSPNSVYANPINRKVRIVDNYITGSVLSPIVRLEDSSDRTTTKDIHFVDVSFSPQNEINKDIIATFGSTIDIDQYIGDPRESAGKEYVNLEKIKEEYYLKYFDRYDFKDYIRLIQFFDNALFKMILDYVPGRDNTYTGVTIKSPILERPKAKTPQVYGDSNYLSYSSSINSSNIEGDSIYISGFEDGRDFYTGELSGSIIDINNIFTQKNTNPYLW